MRPIFYVLAIALAGSAAAQQPAAPPTSPVAAQSTTTATPGVKKKAVDRIPIESAPPTKPTPATAEQEARQRAQDEKVLAQQQAQSAADAKVANSIVKQAQQRQDKVQNEIRIQDAPGPAQTGIVPAAGPPVLPATTTTTAPAQTPPATPPPPARP